MAIFNSYVNLPEGTPYAKVSGFVWMGMLDGGWSGTTLARRYLQPPEGLHAMDCLADSSVQAGHGGRPTGGY